MIMLIWFLVAVRRIFSKLETTAQLRTPAWGSTADQEKGRWIQEASADIICARPLSLVGASRNAPKMVCGMGRTTNGKYTFMLDGAFCVKDSIGLPEVFIGLLDPFTSTAVSYTHLTL